MPEHFKCLHLAEFFACSVTHVKSDLLVYAELPGHPAAVAHPFRVCLGILCRNIDLAPGLCFGDKAVPSPYHKGYAPVNFRLTPAEKTVQLRRTLPPGPALDHEIRRLYPLFPVLQQLAKHRFISPACRIAQEKLYEKSPFLSCFFVVRRKGVPPPVIAALRLLAKKLAGIPADIVLIKHCFSVL